MNDTITRTQRLRSEAQCLAADTLQSANLRTALAAVEQFVRIVEALFLENESLETTLRRLQGAAAPADGQSYQDDGGGQGEAAAARERLTLELSQVRLERDAARAVIATLRNQVKRLRDEVTQERVKNGTKIAILQDRDQELCAELAKERAKEGKE